MRFKEYNFKQISGHNALYEKLFILVSIKIFNYKTF